MSLHIKKFVKQTCETTVVCKNAAFLIHEIAHFMLRQMFEISKIPEHISDYPKEGLRKTVSHEAAE